MVLIYNGMQKFNGALEQCGLFGMWARAIILVVVLVSERAMMDKLQLISNFMTFYFRGFSGKVLNWILCFLSSRQ